MIGITGVSGSGKSTLVNETLYPILNAHYFNGVKEPLDYDSISGLQHLDKVVDINQSPIGRTPEVTLLPTPVCSVKLEPYTLKPLKHKFEVTSPVVSALMSKGGAVRPAKVVACVLLK